MKKAHDPSVQTATGIAMVCIALVLFSAVDADAKWLSVAGYLPFQVAFMRYAGQLSVGVALSPGDLMRFLRLPKRLLMLVALRAASLAFATVCNFVALTYLPLTTTAAIMFSSPLWVCALSGPLLGEKVGVWRWSAVALGMLGVLIAMQPSAEFHLAIFASLAAALFFAGYSLLSRYLVGSVDTGTLQMSTGIVGTLILLPLVFLHWRWPDSAFHWVLLFALGALAWLGHEFYTRAHKLIEASALSPFVYLLFVFMGVWDWLLFNQLPEYKTVLGAMLAVAAGVVIWWRESRSRVTSP